MDAVDALLERLEAPFDIADALEPNYFIALPIDVVHAVAAGEPPAITRIRSTGSSSLRRAQKG